VEYERTVDREWSGLLLIRSVIAQADRPTNEVLKVSFLSMHRASERARS
jgi:hypothetical protein